MNRLKTFALLSFSSFFLHANLSAQEISSTSQQEALQEVDEVVVEGRARRGADDGMDAFLAGDYVKAEILFEKNFISLKRAENGRYNAASDAARSINGALNTSQALSNSTSSASSGQGIAGSSFSQASVSSSLSGNTAGQGKSGRSVLNDGVLTYHDFAYTKYMSGLSEIKLGKYAEAKKSLETSVYHFKDNPDAWMRLGLLYLMDDNYDKAADHLEELERRRIKCKKINCDDYDAILNSASILATEITNKIHGK